LVTGAASITKGGGATVVSAGVMDAKSPVWEVESVWEKACEQTQAAIKRNSDFIKKAF
jgi:hypothetical protein